MSNYEHVVTFAAARNVRLSAASDSLTHSLSLSVPAKRLEHSLSTCTNQLNLPFVVTNNNHLCCSSIALIKSATSYDCACASQQTV